MSAKSDVYAKSRFRVMYLLVVVDGQHIHDSWRDYFGRSFPYVDACEKAEELRGQFGDKYSFKVLHEKLVKKESA